MLRPVLLIGVGGSGGKTLRAMRQTLLRRLRQNGWTKPGLPEGWQMLWVDSVSQQDEDAFPAPLLPNDQYLGLVTPGLNYADLRTGLEQTVDKTQRMDALAGWVPDTVPISVAAGAGQARAIGRVISAAQLKVLKQSLDTAYRRLSGPSVTSELAEVARILGEQEGAALTEPIALVVSSMAGGSGSGMFLDVVETLKGVDGSFKEPGVIMTVLYTPDVFESIKGAGDQIPPNTLGAVMEVTAGVLAPGLTPATEALLSRQGVVARSRHGFGSKANFLVGARNQRISLGSQEAIYHAVGDSLSAIVADSTVQQTLRAFTITNVFLNSGLPLEVIDNSQLSQPSNDDESMPFSALGMARITLGTDRLSDYLTQLVSRDITEHLLWPDHHPAFRDDGQRIPDQERIDERVAERWMSSHGQSGFLIDSGLNERDPADDVIDALANGAQLEARLGEWAAGIVSRAKQNVDAKGMPPGEWVNRLDRDFRERLGALRQTETNHRYDLARVWTEEVQRTVGELVCRESVASGLIVTAALVDRLIEEMGFVVDELKTQAAAKRNQVDLVHGKVAQLLSEGGTWIGADDDVLNRAQAVLARGARLAVDADRRELGGVLLADLTSGFLRPLADAVKTSRARLADNVVSDRVDGGRPNPWPLMPKFDAAVPTQFQPGTTERTLMDVNSFPTIVKAQTAANLKDEEQGNWRHFLRLRASLGQSLSTGEAVRSPLLEVRSSWSPQDGRASRSALPGAKGQFRMPQQVREVEELVMAYMADPNASQGIARFLRQGIADYVQSGTADQQVERQNSLIAALTDAVQVAAPFVEVNAGVKAHLHPNVSDQLQLVVTTIPFPKGEGLFERIKGVLVDAHMWSNSRSPEWFRTDGTSEITLFTMTGKAMLPMVFDNVMKPISESWARNSGDPATRHAFWSKRRARPLVEAIPASPEVAVAMLRGWFLAGLLGQRHVTAQGSSGYRAQLWIPEKRALADFPFPLLTGAPSSQNDVPASILKSLAIAMVKVNEVGNLEPLAPYRRLIDLGNPFTASETLGRWIADGTVADTAAPTPDAAFAGPTGDGSIPDQRRKAVAATLERTSQNFEKEFAAAEHLDDPFATPIVWEIRAYIRQAIRDLTAYLTTAQDAAGSGSL
jgi:hypothetical protein